MLSWWEPEADYKPVGVGLSEGPWAASGPLPVQIGTGSLCYKSFTGEGRSLQLRQWRLTAVGHVAHLHFPPAEITLDFTVRGMHRCQPSLLPPWPGGSKGRGSGGGGCKGLVSDL